MSLRAPGSGPVDRDPGTRKRLAPWDRGKFLILLAVAFGVLMWSDMVAFPGLMSARDALVRTVTGSAWILWLAGLEVARQAHFLVSERSAAYHRFWTHRVFGGWNRWTRRRFNDWNRYRIARAVKWAVWIAVVAFVLGEVRHVSPIEALYGVPATVWGFLPTVLQVVLLMLLAVGQFVAIFWFLSRGGVDVYYPDDIKTRFSDVWGQDHVVERVKENIVFLEKPDEIEARGGYVPSGILLWGPPGTGKTLLAEAVAGSTGKPYVFVDPGAFINMFFGVGVLKVKSLFRKLRKLALRYGGVIVFFDEADSLGNRGALAQGGPGGVGGWGRATTAPLSAPFQAAPFQRAGCNGFAYLGEDTRRLIADRLVYGGGMGGGGGMGTLEALLTEISGLKKPRGFVNRYVRRLLGMRPKPPPKYRILIMMATNLPEALDEALLRPGRIDRIYKVGYPSKAGRIRTYQGYFGKVRHELTAEQIDKLAMITPYATGATIKDLVNESLITAIRDGREIITWSDVMRAKRLKQLGPPEDVEYIERERHAVAVHEACHAVVAYRTRHHLEIDIATIEKGADYLGMVAGIKPEDQFTRWRSEYEADIMVSLASLAGERMFFGEDNSSGVSGDLQSATMLTGLMEAHWGMGIGVASLPALQELGLREGRAAQGRPGAVRDEMLPDLLPERIEFNLARLLEKTTELLRDNRREVLSVAHALEQHRTLSGDDVVAVIECAGGPLVDGGVYGSDEFYAEIETYHEAAAQAHRVHSTVSVELPVPPRRELAPIRPTGSAPSTTPRPPVTPPRPPVMPPRPQATPSRSPATRPRPAGVPPAPSAPPPALVAPAFVRHDGFAARSGGPPPVRHATAAGRSSGGTFWAIAGAVTAVLLFVPLGMVLAEPPKGMPSGLVLALAVTLIALITGLTAAVVVARTQRRARRQAEAARDRAAERAQLLAAAMDPEVAMRLLGYDGRRGPGPGPGTSV